MVHHEFLPEKETANREYYLGVMSRLREAICQKRTAFLGKQLMDFAPQ